MGPLKKFIRHSMRLEFPPFVFFFSLTTSVCAAIYTFHPQFSLGFHEIYTLGIILAALFSSAGSLLLSSQSEASKVSRSDVAMAALIFLFGLALGLYQMDLLSVWLDEEGQAIPLNNWSGLSIVSWAAGFQQMPLGYYYSTLNEKIIGANEWGLRLFSCMFIAASSVLFYRLAKLLCKSPLLYSAAPFIYLMNPWMIRYSQEGRPYGFMIFCGLLWLNAVHDLFSCPEERGRLLRSTLVTFPCTLFFLLSLSFQPIILCVTFLFVFGFLLFFPPWRKRVGAFYGAVALSMLAAAPLIQLARKASLHYFHPAESWSSWEKPFHAVLSIPHHAYALFLDQSGFLALVFLFAPLTLQPPRQRIHGAHWIGIACCFVFSVFFLALFSLLINYTLYVRYFLIIYPIGLLLIFAYFDQVSTFFEGGRDRYLKLGWQLIFLAALLAPQLRSLPDAYHSAEFDRWNVDYKAIFSIFRQTGMPGDVGYVVPYASPETWEQRGFLTTKYYYRENTPVRVSSLWEAGKFETSADLILKDVPIQNPQHVFFTFLNLLEPQEISIRKYCTTQAGAEFRIGDRFLICRVPARGGLSKTLETFLSGLLQSIEDKQMAYRMFDVLLFLAEFEKNPGKCQSYLSELKKLNSSHARIQQIVHNHENLCASIKGSPHQNPRAIKPMKKANR